MLAWMLSAISALYLSYKDKTVPALVALVLMWVFCIMITVL